MRHSSLSSVSASIRDAYASSIVSFDDEPASLAISADGDRFASARTMTDAEFTAWMHDELAREDALAARLAFLNDSQDHYEEDYTFGWDIDGPAFEPSEEDLAFYRGIDPDQGFPVGELTPPDQEYLSETLSDVEYRAEMAEYADRVESGRSWL